MPKPIGVFAKAQIDAIEMFEAMQAEAMLFIQETFAMEDDSFKFRERTWEEFFEALERAEKEDRLEEFELAVLQQLGGAISQMGQQNG